MAADDHRLRASMESPMLNAGPWTCASIWLDFDYNLVDRNATGDEKLSVDVFYNGSWHQKTEYANDGSVALDTGAFRYQLRTG